MATEDADDLAGLIPERTDSNTRAPYRSPPYSFIPEHFYFPRAGPSPWGLDETLDANTLTIVRNGSDSVA